MLWTPKGLFKNYLTAYERKGLIFVTFRGTNLRKEDLNTRANVTIKNVTTTTKKWNFKTCKNNS